MRLIWIGVVLLILCLGLAVAGCQEKRLAAGASATPEEISLQALLARGPEGNPNIILKDFALCQNYIFRTRNGIWERAWVPAVPQQFGNQLGGRPQVIQALIVSTHARNEGDLYQRCGGQRLPALVMNRIASLGGEERNLLAQSYPGTDFSRCLIIEEGRTLSGRTALALFFGGAALSGLAALGVGGFGIYLWQKERNAPPRRRRRRRRGDDEDEDEDDRRASRRGRARTDDEDDEGERPRRRPRDDEEDERPARRTRRSSETEEDYEERPRRRLRRDDDKEDADYPPRGRSRDDDNIRRRPPRRDDDD